MKPIIRKGVIVLASVFMVTGIVMLVRNDGLAFPGVIMIVGGLGAVWFAA